jgi:hypothetical protein
MTMRIGRTHGSADVCSWEPNQCRLRRLAAAEARQCLNRKKLVFIGDSISRYMYSSLVHFLSREVWPERYGGQKAHSVVIGREFTAGRPGPDVWYATARPVLAYCHFPAVAEVQQGLLHAQKVMALPPIHAILWSPPWR